MINNNATDEIREAIERAKKMWDNIGQEKPKNKKNSGEEEEAYKRAMDII